MPRNVRNWWLEAFVDGRAGTFAAGPKNKEGGFSLSIKQRDGGDIKTAVQIVGVANAAGDLELTVYEGHTGTKEVLVVRSRR